MSNVAQRLTSGIAHAKLPTTDGGTQVTQNENDAIVRDMLANGVSVADAPGVIARASGLSSTERTALNASVVRLNQVRGYGAVFVSAQPVRLSNAPSVKPANVASQIPALVQSALHELEQGNVAGAARILAPLANATWEVRGGGMWLSGPGTSLPQALATLGVPAPQVALITTLVNQTQVHAEMSTALGRPASLPPSARDLKDYGAALARQKPRPAAQDMVDAFSRYAEAFHRHPGHVDYTPPLSASSALPPLRAVGADGLSTNSCVGYSLMAHDFLSAAGFKCQFVYVESTQPKVPGHAMVYAVRGADAIVTSNALGWAGGKTDRDTLVAAALTRTASGLGANHLPPSFVATLPL